MATEPLAGVLRYIHYVTSTKEWDEQSDNQLLQQFVARRDEGAFAALLQRHGELVFGVCRQVLGDTHAAEDAFQATFLVLARKAASIRKQGSLAAWLYRVAINIARDAKSSTAQQRVLEKQAVVMSQANPVDVVALRDWQPVIHEEVDQLPEKHRIPIVLCYLEGKTHDEAARVLGWPLGTVKGRLARARDLLRARLTRRGLVLSGGAVAAALAQSAAMGHVPATVLGHTLKAAMSFAGQGTIAAGLVSPQALALAKGALKTMTATKLVHSIILLLALGVIGIGAAFGLGRALDGGLDTVAAEKKETIPPGKAEGAGGAEGPVQLTLASTRTEYRTGEAVDLILTIKNNGKEEFSYPDFKLRELDGFAMTGPDGKGVEPVMNPAEISFILKPISVRPGEAAAVKDVLQGINLSKAPGKDHYRRHMYYPMEAPGIYRLRIQVGDATSNELKVKVLGKDDRGMVESRPVRVNAVDFQAVADAHMPAPARGEHSAFDVGLRLINRGDKELVLRLNDTLIGMNLETPDGKVVRGALREGKRARKPPRVVPPGPPLCVLRPGQTETVFSGGYLQWDADGKALELDLEGGCLFRGVNCLFSGLTPGKYRLRVEYKNAQEFELIEPGGAQGRPFWVGEVTTNTVEFEITPPPKDPPGEAGLQGKWQVVAFEAMGKNREPAEYKETWVITKDRITILEGEKEDPFEMGYKFVEAKNAIDMDHELGPLLGIYRLEGDALTICYGRERPKAFVTRRATGDMLKVMKRVGNAADGGGAPKDPSAARLKALKENIASFELHLQYVTAQQRSFSDLIVRAGKERSIERGNAWLVSISIPHNEALKLVEGLAREGFLRKAQPAGKDKLTGEIGFVLLVRNDKYSQHEILGKGKGVREQLKMLRALLDGDAAKALDALLAALPAGDILPAGHTREVNSVALSADGKHVVTGSWDATAILWDAATGKQLQTFQGHTHFVFSVALSADGKQVVTGSHDKTAALWESATGKKLQTFQGHTDEVSSVTVSADGERVVTGSWDRTAVLWEAATGKKLQTFQGHNGIVTSVALAPDGKRVVTGSADRTAILWETASGQKLQTFQGHAFAVLSVVLSADGKQVVTGSEDKTAILWDTATGKKLQTFQGHSEYVSSVALSADGKQVVTGSYDKTAVLWDAASGKKLQTFQGHTK